MKSISKNIQFQRVMNAVAAGTTDQNSTAVDMANFDRAAFVVAFGAITSGAVTSCKLQQGDASDGSDADDLAGTAISVADDDDNQIVILECERPQKRYVRCVVDRGTQNAVIDGIVAMKSGARVLPVTHDSATVVGSELNVSPAEGTA